MQHAITRRSLANDFCSVLSILRSIFLASIVDEAVIMIE